MRSRTVVRITGALLLAEALGGVLWGAPGGLPAAKSDLVEWAAAEHVPPIVAPLDGATYEERAKEVLAGIDRAKLSIANVPFAGIRVAEMEKHGRGAGLGLHVEDVITTIDGEPAHASLYERKILEGRGKVHLKVWSPGTMETRELVAEGGNRLGIINPNFLDAARLYWRNGAHDVRWDDDMLVAGATYENRPNVALTALSRAQGAGCRDALVGVLAAEIAYREDHFDEALNRGVPALEKADPAIRPMLSWDLWSAAALSGHLAVAEQIVTAHPEDFGGTAEITREDTTKEMEDYRALRDWRRTTLLSETEKWEREDLMKSLQHLPFVQNSPGEWDNRYHYTKEGVEQWKRSHVIHIGAQPGKYSQMDFGPIVQNGEFGIEFTLDPEEDHAGEKSFFAGILDYSAKEKKGDPMLQMNMGPDGEVQVLWGTKFGTSIYRPMKNGKGMKHHVRIVIVGQLGEVVIDDRTVFHGVIAAPEKERNLLGFAGAQGENADVTGLRWMQIHRPNAGASTQP